MISERVNNEGQVKNCFYDYTYLLIAGSGCSHLGSNFISYVNDITNTFNDLSRHQTGQFCTIHT